MSESSVAEYEYRSEVKPTWCPGCGDFGVLNALYNALGRKGYNPKDIVCVSGIGCSSRLPYFVTSYGFHSVHGRAMPIATGVKMANPELTVLVFGGDGDAYAIGGGHFIHAARRNTDLTYVIMDNTIYGLTKGQTSPTSQTGFVTKTTPRGSVEPPFNPIVLALASGASFVARGFSGKPKEMADLIVKGIEHPGFSIIDVYSPCPTFNTVNTFKTYKEEVADLPSDHDVSDRVAALRLASLDQPRYLGIFYHQRVGSFQERVKSLQTGDRKDSKKVLDSLFQRFS
ncbi:MAG: 2-oxoacid:ferredoxin oxidoreductase subunit beta [Armatimonadetes bacterium]|nr:2-oxoacid:ferredoxin oxidoreductase subunit beta [Armatimonadota bacterium]